MFAQNGEYDIRLDLHNADCDANKIYVNVEIRATTIANQFNIADQNYRFSFNRNAVDIDSVKIDHEYLSGVVGSSAYLPHTLIGSLDTIVSYNVLFGGGAGVLVDTSWLKIGRLSFEIIDFNECLDLTLHPHFPVIHPPTFISESFQGAFHEVDEGLYFNTTICPVLVCTGYSNLISGNLFIDSSLDCAYTNGESGFGNGMIRISGDAQFFRNTDSQGNYSFNLDSGSYSISGVLPNQLYENCFPISTFSIDVNDTISLDIPLKPLLNCTAMDVSMSNTLIRRCMESDITVVYCNNGTIDATNTAVGITIDTALTALSSTLPWSSQNGNTYSFLLGTVSPGGCGSFKIKVLNSCYTIQGQAVCLNAHIFPDTLCTPPTTSWDGSITDVRVACQADSVEFTIENIGTGAMGVPLDYYVIEEHIILKIGSFKLDPNQTLTTKFPSNGSTYRIYADQISGYFPDGYKPTVAVEGCGTNMSGTFSTGFINDFPILDNLNTSNEYCDVVVGPLDPNDKSATPEGVGSDHLVLPNTDLNYKIRFQNVGTDTVFNIVVRDTLSQHLDLTTIQNVAASLTYRLDIESNNILVFTFPDIKLVDSTANEPDSHGYLTFTISQQPNLPFGTMIYNDAAIYFDFESPVITNQTWHELGEIFIQISTPIDEIDRGLNNVKIIPNPFNEYADIVVESSSTNQKTITACDALGRVVLKESYSDNSYRVYKNQLSAGLYFFTIQDENGGMTHSGRFVIK